MIGERIHEDLEIVAVLGSGAFGTVYRARQISLNRAVAVKFLDAAIASPQDLKRFQSEARHLASLTHPHVVRIHTLGEFKGNPYIVMELLEGQTLRTVTKKNQSSMGEALRIMADVAAGLHAIHSIGIIHRDLSPNNIMVSAAGAKVFDLGLAKDLSAMSTGSSEFIMGTVGYMAPEQIEGGEISSAADIFSFGVILYELLSGKSPFQAEHQMSVLYNIVHRDPTPVSVHVPDCPDSLAKLVMQCLQKNPAERPSSMDMLEQEIRKIRETSGAMNHVGPPLDQALTIEFPSHSTSSNPYLNRMMIRRRDGFFGRKQEVRRIFARLNATPPGSVSIVGDRKIGKSSLLSFVSARASRQVHLAEPDRVVMVFMDLQQEDMTMEVFVRTLIQMTSMELRGRVDISDCTHDLDGLKTMVRRIDAKNLKLAILLDEFERITANPKFPLEFFSFLRSLANHYSVAYLTSSARDLQSLCHTQAISDSPFFNIFSTMRLSVLQKEEAEELVCGPSRKVGVPLEGYVSQILEISGLFPFFIQITCSHTLDYLEEHGQSAIPDFIEIRRRFYEEAKFHYRDMWLHFDPSERSAIRRLAKGAKVPDALQHVLEELAGRHYVEFEAGNPKLFSATFSDFARHAPRTRDMTGGWRMRWREHLLERFLLSGSFAKRFALLAVVLLAVASTSIVLLLRQNGDSLQSRQADNLVDGVASVAAEKVTEVYVLSVGISRYEDVDYGLQYADDDAVALAAAFKAQEGELFTKVHSRVLTDEQASRGNIMRELAWLRDSALQDDLVVLTLSGHGAIDSNDRFFFLPFDYEAEQELSVSGISNVGFLDYLENTHCTVLMLTDTCHSGKLARGTLRGISVDPVDDEITSALREFSKVGSGVVVMSACLSRERALEKPEWGHGALTLAFLEGMQGKRLYNAQTATPLPVGRGEKGILFLSDIDHYVKQRVRELTEMQQRVVTTPTRDLPTASIPIAVGPND